MTAVWVDKVRGFYFFIIEPVPRPSAGKTRSSRWRPGSFSLLLLLKFVLLLCMQSVAVPPGFNNFLALDEELLSDSGQLAITNSPTVLDVWFGAFVSRNLSG